MKWHKIKNLFSPENNFAWMVSHAANPTPVVLDAQKGLVRIFFTCRNRENKSYIGFADFDFNNDFQLLNLSDTPVLSPGSAGMFDDSGVAMGWILHKDNKYLLYYLGWNLKVTVPWLNTVGLATSSSIDGPFEKYSRAPLMDRSDEDPFSISYPSIIFDNGVYRMWYGSNLAWGASQEQMAHVIKYAESRDAIDWKRTGQVHIPLLHKGEYAISRPCVVKFENIYRMWYSYRASEASDNYRIGMAESTDGNFWKRRDDDAGIDVSAHGWDSEAIQYAYVFNTDEKYYMLYNGNGYGKTGFGIAILEI